MFSPGLNHSATWEGSPAGDLVVFKEWLYTKGLLLLQVSTSSHMQYWKAHRGYITLSQAIDYLIDDVVHMIRLEHHTLEQADFAGSHTFIQDRRIAPEGVSQVARDPPLLQNVLKVISFLQHGVPLLQGNVVQTGQQLKQSQMNGVYAMWNRQEEEIIHSLNKSYLWYKSYRIWLKARHSHGWNVKSQTSWRMWQLCWVSRGEHTYRIKWFGCHSLVLFKKQQHRRCIHWR